MGRNIEYYRELFPMAESISVIISDEPGNVNLKIALQYINAILKTGNNQKVRIVHIPFSYFSHKD